MNRMNGMFDDIENVFTAKEYEKCYSDIESLI